MKPINMSRGRRGGGRNPYNRLGPKVDQRHDVEGKPGGGPLVTSHLRDLDLELALLKRKREILEQQQQQIISNDRFGIGRGQFNQYDMPPSSYNQPRFDDQPSFEPSRNFPQYYDPQNAFDNYSRQGTKRPAIEVWEDSSMNKRFIQEAPIHNRFPAVTPISRHAPKPRSQPVRDPWPNKSRPSRRSGREPNLNKVTKPKPVPAPNQINTYPVSERKALVSKAAKVSSTSPAADENILRPDVEPSRTVTGRLELALGQILKELRHQFANAPEYTGFFNSLITMRPMKQLIRERIRSVMLNKKVLTMHDVLAAYREKFPKETDVDVLKVGQEGQQKHARTARPICQEERPEDYFKRNFNKLLDTTLKDMFEKLKTVYRNEGVANKSLSEIITEIQKEEGFHESYVSEANDSKTLEPNDSKTLDANDSKKLDVNDSKELDANVEKELETNDSLKKEDDKETSQNNGANGTEEKDSNPIIKVTEENVENATEEGETKTDGTEDGNENEMTKNVIRGNKSKYYNRVIEQLLKRRLPYLLPRYKEQIITLIDVNEEYNKTKASIIMKTNEKAERIMAAKNDGDSNDNASNLSASQRPPIPYFVKILGRPSLPKRRAMQTFLTEYHPLTIKKHKTVHNLLFVGFGNKEDFENILVANNTYIGSSRLDIKISEKMKPRPLDESGDIVTVDAKEADVIPVENPLENIDSELDGQINDLLSSIRGDEQKNNIKPDSEVGVDKAVNDDVVDVTEIIDDDDVELIQDDTAKEPVVAETVVEAEKKEAGNGNAATSKAPASSTPIVTRRSSRLAH